MAIKPAENIEMMKNIYREMDRRRFLKEGLFWGCLALAFPLLKKGSAAPLSQTRHIVKARHYRHLAG